MARAGDACRAAALSYAQRGWSVVPIEPAGKRPLLPWTELQTRRAAAAEIERWFARWPEANVGIVTGAISGLLVLDVDPAHGGGASLEDWRAVHGPLPATVEARTGGGGRHLYFRHPGEPIPNRVGVAPGIDIRADGGCVVAPPSLHASGKRYTWVPDHAPDEIDLAPPTAWLLALVRPEHTHPGHPLVHWRTLVRTGVEAGSRNSTLASLAGHLLWHGVDAQVVLELLLAWNQARCRPPLAETEVAQVVASIARLHEREGRRA